MPEPTTPQPTIELTIRPPGSVAEAIDRRIQRDADAEWYASMPAAPPTETPGATPTQDKPSAIEVGAQATMQAQRQGGKMLADALMELATGTTVTGQPVGHPMEPAQRAFQGLVSILGGWSGLIGLGAGAGQALENMAPNVAASSIVDAPQARALRMALGGALKKPTPDEFAAMTPEQQRAYQEQEAALSAPMTAKEALDTAIQIAAPALAPRAIKGAKAVAPKVGAALTSERGAIGAEPPGPMSGGAMPGETSRLADVVKLVDARSERIAKNRERQTHGMTVETSRSLFPTFEDAYKASLEELAGSKAKLLRYGDYYKMLEREVMDLSKRAQAGDAEAATLLDDAMPMLIEMAGKQIEAGSTIGRSLEALKIMADASRVTPRTMRLQTRAAAEAVTEATNGYAGLVKELEQTKTSAGLPTLERALVKREQQARRLEAQIADAQQQAKDVAALTTQAADAGKEVAALRAQLAEATKAGKGEDALARKVEQASAQADALTADLKTATETAEAVRRMEQQLAEERQAAADLATQIKAARKRTPNVERLEAALLRSQEALDRLTQDWQDSQEAWRYAQGMLDERGYNIKDVAALKERLRKEGVSGADLAAMLGRLPAQERTQTLSRILRYLYTGTDIIHWAFLQSILSGRATHYANILATGAMQLYRFPEHYVEEWINRIFVHSPDAAQRGETWAMMRASGQAATDGVRLLGKALLHGEQPLGASKVETRFDISARYFGRDPATPVGRLIDIVGMFTPTRWLMSADGFWEGMAKRYSLSALSLREGLKAGYKHPRELAEAVAFFDAHPTPEMVRQAERQARYWTLNADLGPVGSALMDVRNAIPGASFQFPFMRTPGNSFKWAWQRTPVLSLLSMENWKAISAGGDAKVQALARMSLGNAIGAAVVWQVLQGNITGALPAGSNKNLKRDLKAEGVQPYAIRSGDEFYFYKRMDPVGQYLASIATAVEVYSQWGVNTPEAPWDWGDFAMVAGLAASRSALDAPWVQGLGNVFDAIEQPDVNGKKIALGLARGIVPNVLREATTSGIPGIAEARPEIRELESIVDVIKSSLFAFADNVPPKVHPITGQVIVRPPGWGPDVISPVLMTTLQHDPVLNEILTHGMNFPEPAKTLAGHGDPTRKTLDPTQTPDAIPLKGWDYFRLKQMATTEIKDRNGRTLHAAMTAMIQSPQYQQASGGPDGGKEYLLQLIYHQFYQKARAELAASPEFRERVRGQKVERLERLRRPAEPSALTPTLGR